jgi:GNAT superfamily N-acetyltransferase
MEIRTGLPQDIELLIDIDNDASALFENAGLHLDAATDLEITLAARDRWQKCLSAGTVLIGSGQSGDVKGFAAVGTRDAAPYLDQLSVRACFMRQGIGTELLYAAMTMAMQAGGHVLWLTTYNHLSWNRPYYERHGFAVIPAERCGKQMRAELRFEHRLLPDPQHRVVMCKQLPAGVILPSESRLKLSQTSRASVWSPTPGIAKVD